MRSILSLTYPLATVQRVIIGNESGNFFIGRGNDLENLEAISFYDLELTVYYIEENLNQLNLYCQNKECELFAIPIEFYLFPNIVGFADYCLELTQIADTCFSVTALSIQTDALTTSLVPQILRDTIVELITGEYNFFNQNIELALKYDKCFDFNGNQASIITLEPGFDIDNLLLVGYRLDTTLSVNDSFVLRAIEPFSDSLAVQYYERGCLHDTLFNYEFSAPPSYDFPDETIIPCNSVTVLVQLMTFDSTIANWLIDSTTNFDQTVGEGTYLVEFTSGACRDTISLRVEPEKPCFFNENEIEATLPNAFSPNNDGNNDLFDLPPGSLWQIENLSIYDRWGNCLLQNSPDGWTGTVGNALDGEKAAQDVFVYLARLVNTETNQKVDLTGDVTLLR